MARHTPRGVYIKRVLCKFFDPLNVRARRRRRSSTAPPFLFFPLVTRISNRVAPPRPITRPLRSLVILCHVSYYVLSRRLSDPSRAILYIFRGFLEIFRRRRVAPLNTERIDSKTRPRVNNEIRESYTRMIVCHSRR